MKKDKLKLGDIKVSSYVTSIGNKEKKTINGGRFTHSMLLWCPPVSCDGGGTGVSHTCDGDEPNGGYTDQCA